MSHSKLKWIMLAVALAAVVSLGACKKKVQPPPPPPPPPPAAPTASLKATPDTIQRGQSASLVWTTSNATDVNLEGIGTVGPDGSRSVSPSQSTTYRLVAKGAGGTVESDARVTVTEPPPPPPPPPSPTDAELFQQNVKDIFFDFDKSNIRSDQEQAMQADTQFLAQHPNIQFTVEGHCDERGSVEYNLALGENRANSVKQALVAGGVNADRIHTISYGKEKPFCSDHTEECWQQNRRGHFVYQK
jgi:peptidoglycan-associated lipoprotein